MAVSVEQLSVDQLKVYEALQAWVKTHVTQSNRARRDDGEDAPFITVGGYAGTGKTTLISCLATELVDKGYRIGFCAFTGKAANVIGGKLRAAGIQARCGTIHSFMYAPVFKTEEKPVFDQQGNPVIDPETKVQMIEKINKIEDWAPANILGELDVRTGETQPFNLVVVDEASMVDSKIWKDLRSFGVPIVAVGDHGQLPPIGENPGLMVRPQLRLERIHRQAVDNPIIQLATHIREGGSPLAFRTSDPRIQTFRAIADIQVDNTLDIATICFSNKKRVAINEHIRGRLGFDTNSLLPHNGEIVICLKNAIVRSHGAPPERFFNGMRGFVSSANHASGDRWFFNASVEFPEEGRALAGMLCREQFGALQTFRDASELPPDPKTYKKPDKLNLLFDYGYALTCHKCVDPTTLMETPLGLLPIADVPLEGCTASYDGPRGYTRVVRNANTPMMELRSSAGYVRMTPDHGVFRWDSNTFSRTEAQALRGTDLLRVRLGATCDVEADVLLPGAGPCDVRARRYPLPAVLNADSAEFLGLMVGDGTVWRSGFRLAKRHKDVTARFSKLCFDLFGVTTRDFQENGAYQAEVSSVFLADWLRAIGGCAPNTKMVPTCVLRAPLRLQAVFLRGLFEDGTVNMKGDAPDHIEWSSVHPQLIAAVQVMLFRFGVVSSRRDDRLYIYGDSLRIFRDKIGFIAEFKRARLLHSVSETTKYNIPLNADELRAIWSVLPPGDRFSIEQRMGLSYRYARALLSQARAPQDLLRDKLKWHYATARQIVESTPGPSMCVEVPGVSRFLQNGFDFANSQGSQFRIVNLLVERFLGKSPDDARRWLYTAVTRASDQLNIVYA